MPSAVRELVYGIVFGPYLLDLIAKAEFIELMAHLGFAILMFSAGMEIDFAPLRKRGSKLLGTAIGWVALCAGVAVAEIGYKLGEITEETQATLILIAITAGLFCTFLARAALPAQKSE